MEIKTTLKIINENTWGFNNEVCVNRGCKIHKKWVAVDDVYQMIKDAPDKDYVGEYIIRKLRELSEIKDE